MDSHVYPAGHWFERADPGASFSWERPAIMAELKAEARRRGLWNLFLTHSQDGAGLSNLQYAPLAEILGRSPLIAPEALNCSAPDTGNMELLSMFGSPEQKERWLAPMLAGEIRSAYCMTEPAVASSDATNLRAEIRDDGSGFVLTGTKWWSTGIMSPDCRVLLVLGLSDPEAVRHRRYSVLVVPRDAPGVEVRRGLSVFGYWDQSHGGHGEVHFDGVRLGPEALLGEPGQGFALGQARLGPGRIHHCMRLVGMAERAFELLCRRALDRQTFGSALAANADVQRIVAEARVRID